MSGGKGGAGRPCISGAVLAGRPASPGAGAPPRLVGPGPFSNRRHRPLPHIPLPPAALPLSPPPPCSLTLNVRKMFQEMDGQLYEQCRQRYEEQQVGAGRCGAGRGGAGRGNCVTAQCSADASAHRGLLGAAGLPHTDSRSALERVGVRGAWSALPGPPAPVARSRFRGPNRLAAAAPHPQRLKSEQEAKRQQQWQAIESAARGVNGLLR